MYFELVLANSNNLPKGKLTRNMISEIAEIVLEAYIGSGTESIRSELSTQFRNLFGDRHWELDTNLLFEPARAITMHFYKEGVEVLVSWRHYGKIGTEMLKFQTDFSEGRIACGVYICITEELSEYTGNAFSGSITMEKAMKYLESVKQTIQVPIVIIGLIP